MNNTTLVQFKTECLAKPEFKGVFQRMLKTGLAYLELQYKTAVKLQTNPGTEITAEEAASYMTSKDAFRDAKFALLEAGAKARMKVPFFTVDDLRLLAGPTAHE